jgi:hypothetical protein
MKSKIIPIIFTLFITIFVSKIVSYKKASPVKLEVHKEYHDSFREFLNKNEEIKGKSDFKVNQDVFIVKTKFFQMQSYESAMREVSDIIVAWAKTRKYQAATYQFGPLNFLDDDVPVYFQIGKMRRISEEYPDNVGSPRISGNIFPQKNKWSPK